MSVDEARGSGHARTSVSLAEPHGSSSSSLSSFGGKGEGGGTGDFPVGGSEEVPTWVGHKVLIAVCPPGRC